MPRKAAWSWWRALVSIVVGFLTLMVVYAMIDEWWQFRKLKNPNPAARIEVIDELSGVFCSDRGAVTALINLVQDQDADVRAHAAQGLGKCKDDRAIQPLIVALNSDRDPAVQRSASDALHKFTDVRAVEALDDNAWARVRATDTTEAYESYLTSYSNGSHVKQAKSGIDRLQWERSKRIGSAESYEEYLRQADNGAYVCDARLGIARRQLKISAYREAVPACADKPDQRHAADTELQRLLKREEAEFLAAKETGDASLRDYLDHWPDGQHAAEAAEILEQSRRAAELEELLMRLVSLPEDAVVPRTGVKIYAIDDEGEHGRAVVGILRSLFVGVVELLDLRLGMETALNRVAADKLGNPGYDIVVNMSFAHEGSAPVDWENAAFEHLRRSGVVFVAAAGNEGGEVRYPARYEAVIGVGTVTPDGKFTDYTNRGPGLAICAVDRTEERVAEFTAALKKSLSSEDCMTRLAPALATNSEAMIQFYIERYVNKKMKELTKEAGTSFAAPIVAGFLAQRLALQEDRSIQDIIFNFFLTLRDDGPCRAVIAAPSGLSDGWMHWTDSLVGAGPGTCGELEKAIKLGFLW